MQPKDHRNLVVWQRAIDLGVLIHEVVEEFTLAHSIAYGAQLRRAAVSVASNISEGAARQHRGELIQFLSIARGSLAEVHAQRVILGRVNLIKPEQLMVIDDLIDHISRMLTKSIQSLRRKGD